jgi:hypothetical protein
MDAVTVVALSLFEAGDLKRTVPATCPVNSVRLIRAAFHRSLDAPGDVFATTRLPASNGPRWTRGRRVEGVRFRLTARGANSATAEGLCPAPVDVGADHVDDRLKFPAEMRVTQGMHGDVKVS